MRNENVSLRLQHDRLAGLLTEFEREKGPIEPRIMEEVRQAWPDPGKRTSKRRGA